MLTKTCQLCGSKKLNLVLDLGHQPLADTFLTPVQLDGGIMTYPLRLLLCENCGYVTLQYVVPASERYQANDYSYTSANSPVAIAHFEELAKQVSEKYNVSSKDLVVDVGSNVGTLLAAFKRITGGRVCGVEPAANIAKIAQKQGVPTVNDFFNQQCVKRILKEGQAKVITATNVFNHVSDLNSFMKDISDLLTADGVFVFEVPYLLTLMENYLFDTVYLEHVSYFGLKPLVKFFKKFNLSIAYAEQSDYMGGSIRVYVSKSQTPGDGLQALLTREEEAGIYQAATYANFQKKIEAFKFDLVSRIYELKARGEKIIGIGAATKGNTLLNYCGLDHTLLDFVTDASPLKQGKFTPGSNIPIKSDADISPEIRYGLILPWNIADFLVGKLNHLKLEFIIPKIKK